MFKSMSMTCLTLDKFPSLYLQFLNYKMRVKVSTGDGNGSLTHFQNYECCETDASENILDYFKRMVSSGS